MVGVYIVVLKLLSTYTQLCDIDLIVYVLVMLWLSRFT